jgi:hypothetical protein
MGAFFESVNEQREAMRARVPDEALSGGRSCSFASACAAQTRRLDSPAVST